MKHRTQQVDGIDDIHPEVNIKIKENEDNKNKGDNEANDEMDYYKIDLDSKGNHIGQGTHQLCEFLKEPPAKVIHPEYGKGIFTEIDKDWGTFVYKFCGVTAEV